MYPSSCCAAAAAAAVSPSPSPPPKDACCLPVTPPPAPPPVGDASSKGGSPGKVARRFDRSRLLPLLPPILPLPKVRRGATEGEEVGVRKRGEPDPVESAGSSYPKAPEDASDAACAVVAARCGQVLDFWPTLCFRLFMADGGWGRG